MTVIILETHEYDTNIIHSNNEAKKAKIKLTVMLLASIITLV